MSEGAKGSKELEDYIDNVNDETLRNLKEKLLDIYNRIIERLKFYCDLNEEYYNIVALWVIGTYFHKEFETYPYLFINAMRGSGKSRLLKLIAFLSRNGKVENDMSEAVLFRTAKDKTFCIDEFENIGSKEKGTLRTLLNSAYKKGTIVERARKVKSTEDYVVEKFELYAPICMANIWGMESVLSDRCITLILEKSNDPMKTKLMEIFDYDEVLKQIKVDLSVGCEVYVGSNTIINTYKEWNLHLHTLYTTYTIHTQPTLTFFDKVLATSLNSRHLELFFPLLLVTQKIDEKLTEITLQTADKIIKEKKDEDILNDKDISLIEFVSEMDPIDDFIQIKYITESYKNFLEDDEETKKKKMDWLSNEWMGRALKRLVLIRQKRRIGRGIEILIDYDKAKNKIKMFKPIEFKLEIKEEKVE